MEVMMSVRPRMWPEVPEQTAVLARASFPRGSLAMRIRDHLGAWCQDADFAGLYEDGPGRPGLSPAQLMVVTALQFAENMTDRQAADAVRGRIDWKYCLGLEMTDSGFDFSVLSLFRDRLVAGEAGRLPLDLMLTRLRESGLVLPGMRQRTDSTHVLARIRILNRLELAGEAVRAALEALARAEPAWLAGLIDASWLETYGRKICDLRLPEGRDARARLAEQFARDGYWLLEQAAAPGAPPAAAGLPALRALRVILLQQFYRADGPDGQEVRLREESEHGLPPGRAKLLSPYDPDARWGQKKHASWGGYKAHYSETVSNPALDDPDTGMPAHPSIVTCAQTTCAAVPDVAMTSVIHQHLDQAGLAPGEHVTDSGYASADLLVTARGQGITMITPLLPDPSWQARENGYTSDKFTIDWDARAVTCPQGTASTSWSPGTANGAGIIVIRFPPRTCRACPARDKCTRSSSGRQLTLRPREVHDAVTAARAQQETGHWQAQYASRAGVEGLMRQATHVTGIRRARYLGLPKTALEHNIAAVALNLIRLDDWHNGNPPDRGHLTSLARLDLAA
jgi:transposase